MVKIENKLKKGYSLVEVLVALAILMIGILPIVSMYPQIFTVIQKSTENEERSRIALQIIDYMKVGGYVSLLNIVPSNGNTASGTLNLTPIAIGSKTYEDDNFETQFVRRFDSGVFTVLDDFFLLNSKKGMDLSSSRIYWAIANTNVNLVDGGTNPTMYRNFIVGTVVIGTGRSIPVTVTNPTGREKQTRMQFIVTPID